MTRGSPRPGRAVTLMVGTDKGLFVCRKAGAAWQVDGPQLPGYSVLHVVQTPHRPGQFLAAARHRVWGAHLFRSDDAGRSWDSLEIAPHHPPGRHGSALKAIWHLAWSSDASRLYAGIDPAGLFVSEDDGNSWQDLPGLNEHPTRACWEPSRGIFAVHSICIDPGDPRRMLVAISAGGAYRSEDAGMTWTPANQGVRAENLPKRFPQAGHNVHRIVMHAASGRLYRQCYSGTYRSDDWGRHWHEITAGLPSDFGYAIACDPNDADTVFQIPESGADLRITVDAKLRVFRSRDGGAHWVSASAGLPQQGVYVSVLREAIDTDDREPCGVFFGTSTGQLFASKDASESWEMATAWLPRILSVRAVTDPQR